MTATELCDSAANASSPSGQCKGRLVNYSEMEDTGTEWPLAAPCEWNPKGEQGNQKQERERTTKRIEEFNQNTTGNDLGHVLLSSCSLHKATA